LPITGAAETANGSDSITAQPIQEGQLSSDGQSVADSASKFNPDCFSRVWLTQWIQGDRIRFNDG